MVFHGQNRGLPIPLGVRLRLTPRGISFPLRGIVPPTHGIVSETGILLAPRGIGGPMHGVVSEMALTPG